jgi:hypothetical protein
MRVNVYAEELTRKVEVVAKTVNQQLFYGIRMYLKSHPDLHHSDDDNDESAITIWVPWTRFSGNNPIIVLDLLALMHQELEKFAVNKGDLNDSLSLGGRTNEL